jgi:hydrogenase maturation protease
MNEWEWQLLEDKPPLDRVPIGTRDIRVGDRVCLKPRKGGDVMDIALAGQAAIVESIEQDYEGKIHVCVVLEDDPGRDLGMLRQPGHRFFFDVSEVELLAQEALRPRPAVKAARVLVAGIGNIFLGDDGFGVEVIRRLAAQKLPDDVKVVDFGIRGYDLAYALQDGYETTILVDAYPHGQPAGTVSLVEPDLNDLDAQPAAMVDAHAMNPLHVLRMAKSMSGALGKVLLIGCEPQTFGPEEGQLGLSENVEGSVNVAVEMVVSAVHNALGESKTKIQQSP